LVGAEAGTYLPISLFHHCHSAESATSGPSGLQIPTGPFLPQFMDPNARELNNRYISILYKKIKTGTPVAMKGESREIGWVKTS